ncbi:Protein FecR [compost metagenome]
MSPMRQRCAAIDEQAAQWFSRQRSGAVDPRESARFAAWLAEDAEHAAAYREIERLWADFDELPRPLLAQPLPRRRARWLAAASLLFGVLLGGSLFWSARLADPMLVLDSAPGEQREVALEDGSRVFLAGGSALRLDFSAASRDVRLLRGEAFFQVAHDAARPFLVHAGDSLVRVVGTQFAVRLEGRALTVAVKQGRVALRPSLAMADETLLGRGERARLDRPDGRLELAQLPAARVADWRDGMLVFRDRPLGELVGELSRYSDAPILLGNGQLARQRISGSVRIDRVDDFLAALPALVAVRLDTQADGSTLILPR